MEYWKIEKYNLLKKYNEVYVLTLYPYCNYFYVDYDEGLKIVNTSRSALVTLANKVVKKWAEINKLLGTPRGFNNSSSLWNIKRYTVNQECDNVDCKGLTCGVGVTVQNSLGYLKGSEWVYTYLQAK